MPTWKYRFLLALNLIEIQEPLGGNFAILDDFLLSNDRCQREKLLSRQLTEGIGGLEAKALLEAPAIIQSDGETDLDLSPTDSLDFLSQLLNWSGIFLNALWMVKDNAVGFELGFLEVWPPGAGGRVHSNFLAETLQKADGSKGKTGFNRSELKNARKSFKELLLPLAHASKEELVRPDLSPFSGPLITSQSAVPRLKRAFYFLNSARSNRDLGMKVAMYCSLFETLFSTDATEIAHKIAHRIAIFLESAPEKRADLYMRVKKAYGIRSKVVHGDELGKDVQKAQQISVDADQIARRIVAKISSSDVLMEKFHGSKADLEDYFLRESFGAGTQ
jgi:hypothetical protein